MIGKVGEKYDITLELGEPSYIVLELPNGKRVVVKRPDSGTMNFNGYDKVTIQRYQQKTGP